MTSLVALFVAGLIFLMTIVTCPPTAKHLMDASIAQFLTSTNLFDGLVFLRVKNTQKQDLVSNVKLDFRKTLFQKLGFRLLVAFKLQ